MHVSLPTFAAAVVLAALSCAAYAGTSTDDSSIVLRGHSAVYYGDLNLNAEQGAKIMLQRIERAAKKACGGHPTFSSITHLSDHMFEVCRREAVQRAVKQLAAPKVTRIYSEAASREF